MIINDAISRRKQLSILPLDLRDPFGSISYDLIMINMQKVGIPEQMRKIIMDSHKNAYINQINKGEEIEKLKYRKE
jgi:hypothetical protein